MRTCLAGPPLKSCSSALQSVEEMALAWEDSMAGVSLGLPSAAGQRFLTARMLEKARFMVYGPI